MTDYPENKDDDQVPDLYCIQHGYEYSSICPICGPWWREFAAADEFAAQWLIKQSLIP